MNHITALGYNQYQCCSPCRVDNDLLGYTLGIVDNYKDFN